VFIDRLHRGNGIAIRACVGVCHFVVGIGYLSQLAEPVDDEGEDIGLAPRSTSIEVAGKSETSVSLTGRPSGPGILTTLGMQIQLLEVELSIISTPPSREQPSDEAEEAQQRPDGSSF
jgi:hypothetical protein